MRAWRHTSNTHMGNARQTIKPTTHKSSQRFWGVPHMNSEAHIRKAYRAKGFPSDKHVNCTESDFVVRPGDIDPDFVFEGEGEQIDGCPTKFRNVCRSGLAAEISGRQDQMHAAICHMVDKCDKVAVEKGELLFMFECHSSARPVRQWWVLGKAFYSPKASLWFACKWSADNTDHAQEPDLARTYTVELVVGHSRLCPARLCIDYCTSDELALALVQVGDGWSVRRLSYDMPLDCNDLLSMCVTGGEAVPDFGFKPPSRGRGPSNPALLDLQEHDAQRPFVVQPGRGRGARRGCQPGGRRGGGRRGAGSGRGAASSASADAPPPPLVMDAPGSVDAADAEQPLEDMLSDADLAEGFLGEELASAEEAQEAEEARALEEEALAEESAPAGVMEPTTPVGADVFFGPPPPGNMLDASARRRDVMSGNVGEHVRVNLSRYVNSKSSANPAAGLVSRTSQRKRLHDSQCCSGIPGGRRSICGVAYDRGDSRVCRRKQLTF